MKRTIAAVIAVLSLTAFANDFVPTGNVRLNSGIADFNDTEVRGPNVSIVRRADGTWGGTIGSTALDVDATGTRIAGAAINLKVTREGDTVQMGGTWNGRTVEMLLAAKQVKIRRGSRQVEFLQQADGHWQSPDGLVLELTGQATQRPLQTLLALMSCSLSSGSGTRFHHGSLARPIAAPGRAGNSRIP